MIDAVMTVAGPTGDGLDKLNALLRDAMETLRILVSLLIVFGLAFVVVKTKFAPVAIAIFLVVGGASFWLGVLDGLETIGQLIDRETTDQFSAPVTLNTGPPDAVATRTSAAGGATLVLVSGRTPL